MPVENHHQVFLQVDNDAFAFMHFDRYYTHGMHLGYIFQVSSNGRLKTRLTQQIYTPEFYTAKSKKYYDRPFAGVFYGKIGYQWLFASGWLEGNLLLGRVGPGAKAEEVQTWYHSLLGFPQPRGWNSQVESGGLSNLDFSGAYGIARGGNFDFWLASQFSWGNFEKSLTFSPSLRLGKLAPTIRASEISGARTGSTGSHETYVQLGAIFQKVFWNASVQGADTTKEINLDMMTPSPGSQEYYLRLVLSYPHFGVSYKVYYRTKETLISKGQFVGSIHFSYLF
ncbi:DUF2219 family protein [Echinicola jeungdonensis]|nr:lipid A deacylase LpxR family protein [Echinicola jeungdonensis]MDN3668414.1 DUF2219 family protein [Echinicola jeungdonensis]